MTTAAAAGAGAVADVAVVFVVGVW